MFINIAHFPIFEKFSKIYSERIIEICPLLGKFKIKVYDLSKYIECKDKKSQVIDEIENESFSYYIIQGKKDDVSTIDSGIVFNELLCENLNFTENELIAAIAHEIGHIMYFYHTENGGNKQAEEIYADSIACKLGLSEYLLSLLEKIRSSDMYSTELCSQMDTRMYWIVHFH